jgi:hypothetical protein
MLHAEEVKPEFAGMANPLRMLALGATLLLFAACQSAPASKASPDTQPGAVSASESKAEGPHVTGADERLWATAISAEMTYPQAVAYCKGLPPHAKGGWGIPSYYQLARAPLSPLGLMTSSPLWTNSAPDRLPLKRYFIDPSRPFAKVSADLRDGVKYRTVCMATSGD